MAYAQLDICEVGSAEYPLIAVLRDTIFGEFGHVMRCGFMEQIDGQQDVLALIAHLEGNPVGFKVGYRDRPGVYHSWTGGVLKEYRGQGLARRMQEWQHGWVRSRGYRAVYFNSFNKFRSMLLFGLSSGFLPVGMTYRELGEISIQFSKDLTRPDAALEALADGERFEGLSRLEFAHADVRQLRLALLAGFDVTGMLHRPGETQLRVVLERR